jgi:hypothetical protein
MNLELPDEICYHVVVHHGSPGLPGCFELWAFVAPDGFKFESERVAAANVWKSILRADPSARRPGGPRAGAGTALVFPARQGGLGAPPGTPCLPRGGCPPPLAPPRFPPVSRGGRQGSYARYASTDAGATVGRFEFFKFKRCRQKARQRRLSTLVALRQGKRVETPPNLLRKHPSVRRLPRGASSSIRGVSPRAPPSTFSLPGGIRPLASPTLLPNPNGQARVLPCNNLVPVGTGQNSNGLRPGSPLLLRQASCHPGGAGPVLLRRTFSGGPRSFPDRSKTEPASGGACGGLCACGGRAPRGRLRRAACGGLCACGGLLAPVAFRLVGLK